MYIQTGMMETRENTHTSATDEMDGGRVAIQSHYSEDVGTDNLAVGIQCCDDSAHGGTKAPGAIADKLVDERGHAKEEEEVYNGQTLNEYVWYCLLGAELGLLHNGVDENGVSKGPTETDDTKYARYEHIVLLLILW